MRDGSSKIVSLLIESSDICYHSDPSNMTIFLYYMYLHILVSDATLIMLVVPAVPVCYFLPHHTRNRMSDHNETNE